MSNTQTSSLDKFKERCEFFLYGQNFDLDGTFESQGIDDLDLIMLVIEIEDIYHIDIDDEQIEKIICLRDLFTIIEGKVND